MSAPARSLLKNPQSHGPHDALGSVRAITDNTGAVVGSYTYGAWGEILSATEPSGFTMPFKFIGGWGVRHDPTTGLYYMRERWYDAAGLQRFLSQDPLRGDNLYAYVMNGPVDYVDPYGLEGGPPPNPVPHPRIYINVDQFSHFTTIRYTFQNSPVPLVIAWGSWIYRLRRKNGKPECWEPAQGILTASVLAPGDTPLGGLVSPMPPGWITYRPGDILRIETDVFGGFGQVGEVDVRVRPTSDEDMFIYSLDRYPGHPYVFTRHWNKLDKLKNPTAGRLLDLPPCPPDPCSTSNKK